MLQTIGGIIQVILFFLKLWAEKDKEKAEKKAEVAKEVVDAFKQTDPKVRASMLSAAIVNINKLHK